MAMSRELSRRSLLGGSTALGLQHALFNDGATSITRAWPRAAQTDPSTELQGRVIISIIQDVPSEAQDALVEAYRRLRPNVEIVWELPGGGEGYTTWLGTQLAAGDIRPDVVSGNYLNDFRDYFDFDQVRMATNPHTGRLWDQDLDWNFHASRNAQGHRTLLATRGVHTMWYYNRALFDRVGAQPPSTWAELADVSTRLQAAGITPISANFSTVVTWWLSAYYFDQYHLDWVETIRAQPGDWNYNPELDDAFVFDPSDPFIHNRYTFNAQRFWRGIRDGVLRYDTPAMAEVVRNMALVFPRHANADLFVAEDYYPPFLQQQAAMIFDTTASLVALNSDVPALPEPFEWGYFNTPPMEGRLVQGPVRCSESAVGEYVSIIEKDQRQVDRTLDFVMFWLSRAGYAPYLAGQYASTEFSPGGPLKINDVQDPPEIQDLFGGVEFIGSAAKFQNWFVSPGGGDDAPLKDTTFNMYKEALEGRMTPEEFGTRYQRMVTDNFDELLAYVQLTADDIDNPARQPGT